MVYHKPTVVDYGDVLDLTEAVCHQNFLDNSYAVGQPLCTNPTIGLGATTATQQGPGGII
jgi:hypothetical protein